jgi:small subunit ribosomal protein S8
MSLSDPIADMLTRIRNGLKAGHDVVEMYHSRLKGEITKVLKKEGYVMDFVVEGGNRKKLRIYLKYDECGQPVIRGLRRESRPGLRKYVSSDRIPVVLGGLGTSVLSSSGGVITGREAKKRKVGGEYICAVW